MQINLNEPIHELDIMALLIKAHTHSEYCIEKHGEVLTDIVADVLNADGVDIATEHYQFFDAYAEFSHLREQITKPEVRKNSTIAKTILCGFSENLHRDWQAFQEFDADKEHLAFLDSVHEFLQKKTTNI